MTGGVSRREVLRAGLATSGLLVTGAKARARTPPLRLRRGLNTYPWFSLTREYPAPRTDYGSPPFQIGRPVPTSQDLRRLQEAGFDFVRIPVDPGPFLAGTPEERRSLLEMLTEAVAASTDAGLKAVVNLHANAATHYWNPQRLLAAPDTEGFEAYRIFAGEVAGALASFPSDEVGFEPANEPMQACDSGAWARMQVELLRTARQAAPETTLVATGACGSMLTGLAALDPAPLTGFGPVLYTFHFYEPYLFSHQGAPWMQEPVYRALNAVPWPAREGTLETTLAAVRKRMEGDTGRTEAEKRAAYEETVKVLTVYFDADPDRRFVDHYLDMAVDWAKRHGIAPSEILMGEFGALRSDERYVASGSADRARYVRDVRESAEERGFAWAFWNMFDGMGVVDDVTKRFDPSITAALGLRMPAG